MKRDVILDAWRGVAILMVLLHHLVYFHWGFFRDFSAVHAVGFWSTVLWRLDQLFVAAALRSGPLGVKLFFVVSGYIITRLMLEEEAKRGSMSLGAFYVRRAFRILPPYLFYVFCIALFANAGWIPLEGGDIGNALSFICNTNASCGWFVVHTWSLATEMQFYLLWPLLFVLIPKELRARFLVMVIGVGVAFSASELFMAHNWIDNGASFACIAFGGLYAASTRTRDYLARYGIFALIAGVCVVPLLVVMHKAMLAHALYRAVLLLALPIIIFSSYRLSILERSRLIRGLSYIGLVSYSLYLWQEVFAAPMENYLRPSLLHYAWLMIVFCLISYFFVERPAIALGRRLLKGRNVAPATEQEALGI